MECVTKDDEPREELDLESEKERQYPIELNLASNQIEELPIDEQEAYRTMFEHAHRLYLHDNRLRQIPTKFIAIGANLRELTLDENFFEEIDFQFLNFVPELKSLSIKLS